MGSVNFGTLDLVSGGTASVSAPLAFTCSNTDNSTVYVRVCFNIGDGSEGNAAAAATYWDPRIMRDTSNNQLKFRLFQNGSQTVWGSTGNAAIPYPYTDVITIARRDSTSDTATMRAEIQAGQAATTPGAYQTNFNGGHTALRFTSPVTNANNVPGDCSSATNGSGTIPFTVAATIGKSCLVSADALDFGSADGLASSVNIDATTAIRVVCSKSTTYDVRLIPSNNNTAGSSTMKGQIAGNTDTVAYRLYSDSGRGAPWGSLTSNDVSATGDGLTKSFTVYGRVPGPLNVQPDNYKDSVTVTVVY
jgi:spore coat protein U-like protein